MKIKSKVILMKMKLHSNRRYFDFVIYFIVKNTFQKFKIKDSFR